MPYNVILSTETTSPGETGLCITCFFLGFRPLSLYDDDDYIKTFKIIKIILLLLLLHFTLLQLLSCLYLNL